MLIQNDSIRWTLCDIVSNRDIFVTILLKGLNSHPYEIVKTNVSIQCLWFKLNYQTVQEFGSSVRFYELVQIVSKLMTKSNSERFAYD